MITVAPIGHVLGGRAEPVDDDWDAVTATIRLDATRFTPDALLGLDAFSHLEVLYHFHLVADGAVHTGARRPRGNPAWPEVGIFAQRGKDRPNRLGISICRIKAVDGLDVGSAASMPSTVHRSSTSSPCCASSSRVASCAGRHGHRS